MARSTAAWEHEHVVDGTTSVLPGTEPTGNRTSAEDAHVLHWSGDRVSEAWHPGDRLGWLTRAGVLPPMPGAGARVLAGSAGGSSRERPRCQGVRGVLPWWAPADTWR